MACVSVPGGLVEVPEGYAFLRKGAVIKPGDLYLHLDSGMWKPVSEEDVGTKVQGVPDIVLRVATKENMADLVAEQDCHLVVTEAMV